MELIKASDMPANELQKLVNTQPSIDTKKLYLTGYVIKQADILEGCFVLEKTGEKSYWLRQMYLTENAVTSLPVLLEAVLALVTSKQAERVIIYSHHPSVDTILEALQFFPQTNITGVDNSVNNSGKWWVYNVS